MAAEWDADCLRLPAPGNEAEVEMVTLADRVVVPQHVLVRFMDRESVLLNLETERYFGLDETGTRMWKPRRSSGPRICVSEAVIWRKPLSA